MVWLHWGVVGGEVCFFGMCVVDAMLVDTLTIFVVNLRACAVVHKFSGSDEYQADSCWNAEELILLYEYKGNENVKFDQSINIANYEDCVGVEAP